MNRFHSRSFVFFALASSFALACSSSSDSSSPPGTDAGTDTPTGDTCTAQPPVTVSVAPPTLDMLTCTKQTFTANVGGTCDARVAWTANGGGSIDTTGGYTAPMQVPTPATVTITATSAADGSKNGTSSVTLHTALPQTPTVAGQSSDDTLFHHQIATKNKRAYAVLTQIDTDATSGAKSYHLNVSSSDDGGKTWKAPVVASDVPNPAIALEAPTIAVDAGDEQTIYVAYTLEAGVISSTSAASTPGGGQTLALAVSTDGGKTFVNHVLESRGSGWEEFADVTSPAAGTVLVEAPIPEDGHLFRVYVDATKGAGFPSLTGTLPLASGPSGAPFNMLKFDGGSEGFESPRVVSDGAQKACIVFAGGYLSSTEGDGKTRVAVQCSNDAGKTFGDAIDLDFETTSYLVHHPFAAFSPSGALAVAWWTEDGTMHDVKIHLALGKPEGGTFTFGPSSVVPTYQLPAGTDVHAQPEYPAIAWDAGTLWMAYLVNDGASPARLIVDKSCDGGTTWSGAQILNGEPPTDPYQWPAMVMLDGAPHVFARKGSGGSAAAIPAELRRLVP